MAVPTVLGGIPKIFSQMPDSGTMAGNLVVNVHVPGFGNVDSSARDVDLAFKINGSRSSVASYLASEVAKIVKDPTSTLKSARKDAAIALNKITINVMWSA